MATKKIRVYELARELGVENQVVLDLAEQLKIGVKSHSSSIDDPSADRVRRLADAEVLRRDPIVDEPAPEPKPKRGAKAATKTKTKAKAEPVEEAPAPEPAARTCHDRDSPIKAFAHSALSIDLVCSFGDKTSLAQEKFIAQKS